MKMNCILFADDQVIIASSENQLQKATHKLCKIIKEYNLKISSEKTKSMAFVGPYHKRTKIVIGTEIIEQVSSFKYLGSMITYRKNMEIEKKLNKFQQICGTINRCLRNKTTRETKLKFYKTVAVPTLIYGSETWPLTKQEERKIEAAEMRFLRRVAGVTLRDQKRSEDIRNELNIFRLNDKIKTNKYNWFQHVTRMDENRFPKQMLNYKPLGHRNIGRPKQRWKDHLP